MSERYHGRSGSVAVGTNKALLNLFNGGTAQRGRVYDLVLGCVATPADAATHFQGVRSTAVGTEGAGGTPTGLDPASPAAAYDIGMGAFSVEPTKTASSAVFGVSMNQRATFRWVAAPGGEFVLPATANAGMAVESLSSTVTTAHECGIWWEE